MRNCSINICKRSVQTFSFAVSLFFLSAVMIGEWAEGLIIDRIVAVVGEEIITQSDLDRHARSAKTSSPAGEMPESTDLLRRLIEERLIRLEIKRKKIAITDSELEFALKDIEDRNRFPNREVFRQAVASSNQTWDAYVSDLEKQLLTLKLVRIEIDNHISLSDEDVQAYYDSHPDDFLYPDGIRLKQLLLNLSPDASEEKKKNVHRKAAQIQSDIKEGVPFDDLILKYSEGPARKRRGELGFFKKGDLSENIGKVVFELEKGEISSPVQTDQGIHFFKIEERRDGQRKPLDVVTKEIQERLISETRAELQTRWMASLFEKTYIEIK